MKRAAARSFLVKGLLIAVTSGILYGLYSAFVTGGMGEGVWADWYGANAAGLTAFTIVYVLGMLGSALNDTVSALWALAVAAARGKLGDVGRCFRSRPGLVMIACAVVGGPIASGAYIIALQQGGSAVAPITALCPVIGAILSRILFKQPLTPRMLVGIVICFGAAVMIASTAFGGDAPAGLALGLAIAFIAALGWGAEGSIAGYGTAIMDYEIGITIRQITSGIVNLVVFVPIAAWLAGNVGLAPHLFAKAATSWPAMAFFVVSGLFSYLSFALWYKGNGMCGTALGMASNGTYSFWVPFFCWIVLGLIMGQEGWGLSPIVWVAAVVMVVGVTLIAVNPLAVLQS